MEGEHVMILLTMILRGTCQAIFISKYVGVYMRRYFEMQVERNVTRLAREMELPTI